MVRKKGLQFLSLVLSFLILASLLIPPAWANEVEYVQESTFWHWLNKQGGIFNGIVAYGLGKACPESPDGYHRSASTMGEGMLWKDDQYQCVCDYCHQHFWAVESDIKQSYNDYVATLPATGYDSSGGLRWSPSHDLSRACFIRGSTYYVYCEHNGGQANGVVSGLFSYSFDCSNNFVRLVPVSGSTTFLYYGSVIFFKGSAPIDGYYSIVAGTPSVSGYYIDSNGVRHSVNGNYAGSTSPTYYSAGAVVSCSNAPPNNTSISEIPTGGGYQLIAYQGIPPVYEITPVASFSGDTYNINTRPTSITGGNYGIVGDNGQITKVEDNSTIVNETNNTYYNPATGQTVPITGWTYDYSDRSYKVTLESGDTATITYGDENITIQEGDTIYNVYYLIDGSGSDNPPCEHDWQEGEATVPTCVRPGSASYVCSLCGQTKTESIPALGHNWQVKQTVTTQYDDTGQLVQAGYTIFECSTCHEQYKSPDGTIPPGGGSGTDPGGEEEGGGFLSWLLGKLGELLGTIGDGILNLLQTALDKIFGGLIDLVNSLFENLAKLVDLFGSVGEAFQVLWTWLPPEITAILVAGVSIFVFVALLKFFMK